jgi:beta-1,4-mannooligosaccharide/beta-1,4-mannosyl-N-acetylglucosamine phosphorylase
MAVIGALTSSPLVTRHAGNPVLSAADVPYNAALIFNAGVTKFQGRYVMVFRNDYGSLSEQRLDGTNLGLAFSDDGINWDVQPQPCFDLRSDEITRAYDPRLTVLDGRCYMCFAVDTHHGLRGGLAVTDDFEHFELLSLTVPDNRNLVLFPQRFDGRYVRLERPMPIYSRGSGEAFDMWKSASNDLRYWGDSEMLLGGESVPFANAKIGPAAPPVKTSRGWLTCFHAVDIDPARGKHGWEPRWTKRYSAGLMLLDAENPYRVLGVAREPLLAPEAPYEIDGGFRNNVIFPTGMILEASGELRLYYGAADTVMCLATADAEALVDWCLRAV